MNTGSKAPHTLSAHSPIRDFMTPAPATIGRTQTLATAAAKMRETGHRHLPVLDGGKLAGVLSQRDVYFVETIRGVDPEKVSVEEAMSSDVYSVAPDALVATVAAEMAEHKYGCALVVEGARVVGIFSTVDALRLLATALGAKRDARR